MAKLLHYTKVNSKRVLMSQRQDNFSTLLKFSYKRKKFAN